jgi:hypothetical protein
MSARSRSPRDLRAELAAAEAALATAVELRAALADARGQLATERAALATERAALAAVQGALAAERARASSLQWRWLDRLHEMADDARALAAIAHQAGASSDLVARWHVAPPPPAEPEAEPEPR